MKSRTFFSERFLLNSSSFQNSIETFSTFALDRKIGRSVKSSAPVFSFQFLRHVQDEKSLVLSNVIM